jgi:hypothetical protein
VALRCLINTEVHNGFRWLIRTMLSHGFTFLVSTVIEGHSLASQLSVLRACNMSQWGMATLELALTRELAYFLRKMAAAGLAAYFLRAMAAP